MREIDGFDFANVARVAPVAPADLPSIVPYIDHRYRRVSTLDAPVVGLSLFDLVNAGTGALHVHSRAELASRFLVPENATIVLSGVDKDPKVEAWWAMVNRAAILDGLRDLGIALITTPNYSLLTDVPRTDNLHAMKRILMVWREMTAAGLSAALHVNARTETDYTRWAELIRSRSEIQVLAFEFATGGGRSGRIETHVAELCHLADVVGRPLDLIIRGGGRKLREFERHFRRVTLLETDAFTFTHRRRMAYVDRSGHLKKKKVSTAEGAPLDILLAQNIAAVREAYEKMQEQPASAPAGRPVRRLNADGDTKTRQMSFVRDLELTGKARTIAP